MVLIQDLSATAFAAASESGAVGISQPVTERRMSKCLAAARFTSSTVTLEMAAGQALTCSMVRPSSMPWA